MNTVHAEGQLRHRFWGEYSAVIALRAANDALVTLKEPWHIGEKNKNVLVWTGNSDELSALKDRFTNYCDDVKKIDSCKYSVDYGEPFEVDIPTVPHEQMSLF
jgi:hypothetical protein